METQGLPGTFAAGEVPLGHKLEVLDSLDYEAFSLSAPFLSEQREDVNTSLLAKTHLGKSLPQLQQPEECARKQPWKSYCLGKLTFL